MKDTSADIGNRAKYAYFKFRIQVYLATDRVRSRNETLGKNRSENNAQICNIDVWSADLYDEHCLGYVDLIFSEAIPDK